MKYVTLVCIILLSFIAITWSTPANGNYITGTISGNNCCIPIYYTIDSCTGSTCTLTNIIWNYGATIANCGGSPPNQMVLTENAVTGAITNTVFSGSNIPTITQGVTGFSFASGTCTSAVASTILSGTTIPSSGTFSGSVSGTDCCIPLFFDVSSTALTTSTATLNNIIWSSGATSNNCGGTPSTTMSLSGSSGVWSISGFTGTSIPIIRLSSTGNFIWSDGSCVNVVNFFPASTSVPNAGNYQASVSGTCCMPSSFIINGTLSTTSLSLTNITWSSGASNNYNSCGATLPTSLNLIGTNGQWNNYVLIGTGAPIIRGNGLTWGATGCVNAVTFATKGVIQLKGLFNIVILIALIYSFI